MDIQSQLQTALGPSCRILRELAGGGMSRVFLAEDIEHGREIVVKVVPADLAGQVNVERFRREIKVAAKLQHPCIVPVLSSGSAEDIPFYTMPFVEGESLRSKLARERGLSVQESVRILRDVSGAVAYAHEHGIVHRDIKPDNILVTKHHAVLLDFGVAKALTESTRAGAPLTSVGVALGTPAYMAPEQAAADPSVDHRADIYSLGVVAYEMLAGRHPFEGRSSQSMLAAHAIENPNSVTVHRPNLPPALSSLVMQMMEKHPGDRPQTAEDVLASLDAYATPTSTPASTRRNNQVEIPGQRKRRLLLAGGIAGSILTVLALSVFAFKGGFGTRELAEANVLVLDPAITGGSAETLRAPADRILDAVNRGLAQVPTANVVSASDETSPNPEKAAALGRRARASKVIATSIYPVGDSLQVQFRLIDAASGNVIRTLTPILVSANSSVGELDGAIDPLLTVVGFATSPMLGVQTIPIASVPSLTAFKQFATGVNLSDNFDPASLASARTLFGSAFAADTSFIQARLWEMWILRSAGNARNQRTSAYRYDTLQTYLTDHRPLMSPFEALLADFVSDRIASERAVQALRRILEINPATPMRRDLAGMLADLNRPFAADSAMEVFLARDTAYRAIVTPWLFRTLLYHYVGDYTKALATARRARKLAPADLGAMRAELNSLAALGDTAGVSALLTMVASTGRNKSFFDFAGDLYLSAAQELQVHGHPEAATRTFAKAIDWFDKRSETDLENDNVRLRAVLTYLAAGRIADAERLLLPLVKAHPEDGRYTGTLGRMLVLKGDTAGALRVERELAILPSEKFSGTPAFERAQIMAELGRRDDAVARLQEAFGQGVGFPNYRARIHTFPNFAKMRGYPPYDALTQPLR